ncbi:MAG: hypothetical protein C4516_10580 [Oxalobacter sp.]|nr:MAG: hypothetical protein C4516_10580 [Oxalobacter sp.]
MRRYFLTNSVRNIKSFEIKGLDQCCAAIFLSAGIPLLHDTDFDATLPTFLIKHVNIFAIQ